MSVLNLCTTFIRVWHPTASTTPFGDPSYAWDLAYTRIPARIVYKSGQENITNGQEKVVPTHEIFVPQKLDITESDMLTDTYGNTYDIINVNHLYSNTHIQIYALMVNRIEPFNQEEWESSSSSESSDSSLSSQSSVSSDSSKHTSSESSQSSQSSSSSSNSSESSSTENSPPDIFVYSVDDPLYNGPAQGTIFKFTFETGGYKYWYSEDNQWELFVDDVGFISIFDTETYTKEFVYSGFLEDLPVELTSQGAGVGTLVISSDQILGSTNKALITYVENYGGRMTNLNLSGAVFGLSQALEGKFGFTPTYLASAQATIATFESTVLALTAGMKLGDSFVIYFSGHGVAKADDNGDEHIHPGELTPKDEFLCLYDADYRDDDFRTLIDSIPSGVKVTIILDMCKAGNATRQIATRSGTQITEEQMREVLFASSGEVYNSYGNVFGGIYTQALRDAINANQNTITAQALHNYVIANNSWPYSGQQTPQIEGKTTNKNARAFLF